MDENGCHKILTRCSLKLAQYIKLSLTWLDINIYVFSKASLRNYSRSSFCFKAALNNFFWPLQQAQQHTSLTYYGFRKQLWLTCQQTDGQSPIQQTLAFICSGVSGDLLNNSPVFTLLLPLFSSPPTPEKYTQWPLLLGTSAPSIAIQYNSSAIISVSTKLMSFW